MGQHPNSSTREIFEVDSLLKTSLLFFPLQELSRKLEIRVGFFNFMELLVNRNGMFAAAAMFFKFAYEQFIDLANRWITQAWRCMMVNV